MSEYIKAFVISVLAGIVPILIQYCITNKWSFLELTLIILLSISIALLFLMGSRILSYRKFGLSSIHDSKKELNIISKLKTCQNGLSFLGVSARTILSAEARKSIEQAFAQNNQLSLKFLLFDPRETEFGKRRALDETGNEEIWDSWKYIILSSIEELGVLNSEGKKRKIEVRVYKSFPIFRALFVDSNTVFLNYYGKGFSPAEINCLKLTKGKNSYYEALEKYYNELWNSSEIILSNDVNNIPNLRNTLNHEL